MTVGLNIEFENDPEKIGIPILEMLAKLRNEGAVKKQAEILDWSVPRLLQIDKSFPDLRNVFAIDTSINQTLICYSLKEMIQKRKRVRSFDGRACGHSMEGLSAVTIGLHWSSASVAPGKGLT